MSIDPYALCPCGSGKKLKFCCSDSIADIERIHRMIEGEQPRAALRHAEQALAKHPGRASLLDLKATLEISLDELDAARATVEEFVAKHSDSPTAHACRALLLTQSDNPDDIRAAAAEVQQALALVERDLPQRLFEALGAVGSALLVAGHIVSSQAHLWLHAVIAPRDDSRARELLVSLNHYSGLPLLLRDQLRFRPWPDDAPWTAAAQQATRLADHGRWREAVAIVDRLGAEHGAHPALVYNRALLGGWLTDERTLVAGLHAFAQLEVPLEDAIEAEAIAQLLDSECKEKDVDSVVRTYDVNDLDALVTRLASDRRVAMFQLDPAATPEGQPRPRHTYLLLDRPQPSTGAGLGRNELPRLVGALALFGRQTDRRERLELTTDKDADYDTTIRILESIAGDTLGGTADEVVVGHVSPTSLALNRRFHFPADTPPDVRRDIVAEERKASIVDRWAELPRPALQGKSPLEARNDPQLRIPLLASVLILEQAGGLRTQDGAFDELRQKLGLPSVASIELPDGNGHTLPLVRVTRVDVTKISDDDLVALFRRAMLAAAEAAVVHLAREAVRRPSIADRIPPREAYRRLLAAERDPESARRLIQEARTKSETPEDLKIWDLLELELFITSGNSNEASAAIERIQRQYAGDSDMETMLYQLLYRLGAFEKEEPWEDDRRLDEPAAVAAAAPAEGGRIWTPDSERAAGGAGGKSTLWTPS
jgi:hypothetical protein